MSIFDLSINLLEASLEVSFLYLILQKNGKLLPTIIFSLINFFIITLYNYVLWPEVFLSLLSLITLFTYASLINTKSYIENLFLVLFVFILGDISATVSMSLTALLFGVPFFEGVPYLFVVISSKILFILLILLSSKYINRYNLFKTNKLILIIFSLIVLEFLYSTLTDLIFYNDLLNINVLTALICLNTLSISLFFIYTSQQKEQEEKLIIQKNLLELKNQELLYKENKKSIQELNKWKHDIKHVFQSIVYSLQNNKTNEIYDIINQYTDIIDNTHLSNYTSNELLNYIINTKNNIIRSKGLNLSIINNINNSIPISDIHFTIILGNLLDNAIENCGKDKNIIIDVGDINGFFLIKVSNSIDKPILKDNPYLTTTKVDKNSHGIGLNNIKLLIQKYNGDIYFDDSNNLFTVKILF